MQRRAHKTNHQVLALSLIPFSWGGGVKSIKILPLKSSIKPWIINKYRPKNFASTLANQIENCFFLKLFMDNMSITKENGRVPFWCVVISKFKTSTRGAQVMFLIAWNFLRHQAPMKSQTSMNKVTT